MVTKLFRSFVAAVFFTISIGYMVQHTTSAGTPPGDALFVLAFVFTAIAFVELTGDR